MDEKQIALIRLVSSRYNELQGLRSVLIGGAFALTMGLALTLPSSAGGAADDRSLPAFAGALALIVPGMFWLDRYYERTFGRLVPSAAQRRWGMIIVPGTLVALMFVGDAVGQGKALFFVAFAMLHLWMLVRDWPWRTHHLLGVAGSLGAAAALWTSGRPGADEPLMWAFMLFGASQVPVGMLDHLLLQRTLKGSSPPYPEHAR